MHIATFKIENISKLNFLANKYVLLEVGWTISEVTSRQITLSREMVLWRFLSRNPINWISSVELHFNDSELDVSLSLEPLVFFAIAFLAVVSVNALGALGFVVATLASLLPLLLIVHRVKSDIRMVLTRCRRGFE